MTRRSDNLESSDDPALGKVGTTSGPLNMIEDHHCAIKFLKLLVP